MKKYILLFLITFILIPLKTNALELERTFTDINNTSCQSNSSLIFESYDNTGILDGHITCDGYLNKCTKYDLENNKVWSNYVEVSNISINEYYEETSIGEIVDALISKTNENGTVEWEKRFGGNSNDYFDSVINSYDNQNNHDGYIVIGFTESTDINNIEPGSFILKYDLNGNEVWVKNINNYLPILMLDDTNTDVTIVYQSSTKEFQIVKRTGETINTVDTGDVRINDLFYSKDKTGKVDGIMVVGTTGYQYYKSQIEKRTSSDINATVKPLASIKTIAVIIKYDLTGTKIWEHRYEDCKASGYHSGIILESPDGTIEGYLTVGGIISSTTSDSIIVMYDLEGNLIWEDRYSPFNNNTYSDITKNYNKKGEFNGYVVSGFDNSKRFEPVAYKNNKAIIQPLTNTISCEENSSFAKYTFKEYPIIKKNTTEGTISVNNKAIAGTIVKINVTPKEGYLLKDIKIKDQMGNEIKITNNSFIMPEGEVTVEASFARLSNPETVAIGYIVLGIVLLIAIATHIINKQKELN